MAHLVDKARRMRTKRQETHDALEFSQVYPRTLGRRGFGESNRREVSTGILYRLRVRLGPTQLNEPLQMQGKFQVGLRGS